MINSNVAALPETKVNLLQSQVDKHRQLQYEAEVEAALAGATVAMYGVPTSKGDYIYLQTKFPTTQF